MTQKSVCSLCFKNFIAESWHVSYVPGHMLLTCSFHLHTANKSKKNRQTTFSPAMSHCHNPKCSFIPSARPFNQKPTIQHTHSPAIPRHQGVGESEGHCESSLSVSDPLQRDANQVHLPATQRLLAAHHASEQRGRSLQFPRYSHRVSNYHARHC